MKPSDFSFGFRVVGSCHEVRRLVDATAAFLGHARCDSKAGLHQECYLSAFQFDAQFQHYLSERGSPKGFDGPCWSPWLWIDIDRPQLVDATHDAQRLAEFVTARYSIEPSKLLIFFSGSKGFHLGIPVGLVGTVSPSGEFHRQCRQFAQWLSGQSKVPIDTGVYDRVRLFRAPNSRHPKTGLHKRRLSLEELSRPIETIRELAQSPMSFELPQPTSACTVAVEDWNQASMPLFQLAPKTDFPKEIPYHSGRRRLNRGTLDFMRSGAPTGDRHRLLFSAAANLAELDCPLPLALELLQDAALDSGLSPSDVRRQIECGWSSQRKESSCHPQP